MPDLYLGRRTIEPTAEETALEQALREFLDIPIEQLTASDVGKAQSDRDAYDAAVGGRYRAAGYRYTNRVKEFELISDTNNRIVKWQTREHAARMTRERNVTHRREEYDKALEEFTSGYERLMKAEPPEVSPTAAHELTDAELRRMDEHALHRELNKGFFMDGTKARLDRRKRQLAATRRLPKKQADAAKAVLDVLIQDLTEVLSVSERNVRRINAELKRRADELEESAQLDANLSDTVRELLGRVAELEEERADGEQTAY